MPLRLQLALVSLCMLLLPWSGWRLLQEMEAQLRLGQEAVLAASAESLVRTLQATPALLPPARPRLFVQALPRLPRVDGEFADWPGVQTRGFADAAGVERLRLALARRDEHLYLRIEVDDATPQRVDAHWPRAAAGDHLQLLLEGPNGLHTLRLANAGDGALIATALDGGPALLRLAGEWRTRADGYQVEVLIPPGWPLRRLGLQVLDAGPAGVQRFGPGVDDPRAAWPLWEGSERLLARLRGLLPEGLRLRLIDDERWVYAEAGELPPADDAVLPWWKRQLWYALAWSDAPLDREREGQAQTRSEEVLAALAGAPAAHWRRDTQAPRLLLALATPLRVEGEVRAVLWLQREQQTLLLADRALSSLVLGSAAAMLVAVGVLLWFAGRLSRRIRALRNAVDGALAADGAVRAFTPSAAGDEVGDLSRSFARLLGEVGASQSYLRGLAGKLSHELTTPLAVVRGALDNIDRAALDGNSRTCVERALGGSERLAAIVRAMSEASRAEQAIAGAEGEDVELVGMLHQCAEAYAPLLAPRRFELVVPDGEVWLHCAPELLVQALDKLIDNARGFCPEDGWVRLALERGVEGPQIVVANQGPLLPESIRHRLFESLVSVRPGGHRGSVHLGFGLFIVRLVTELHGGRAEAQDLPDGSGVEFVLRLRGMPRRAGVTRAAEGRQGAR
jgi:two-component system, OmpR family, sensor histidine kinase ChvG